MLPFDPNQLIPLIGTIGGLVVAGVVLWAFFKSDLAGAIAERIRAGMHRRRRWKGFGGEWSDTPLEGAADSEHVAELERSEERRVGKSVDLGGRRIIKKKKKRRKRLVASD